MNHNLYYPVPIMPGALSVTPAMPIDGDDPTSSSSAYQMEGTAVQERRYAGESCSSYVSCTVEVSLVGTCGFEYDAGVAYSIGTQLVGVNVVDPCGCVDLVLVNGQVPPVLIDDGQPIFINTQFYGECDLTAAQGPLCDQMAMMARTSDGRKFVRVKKSPSKRRRIFDQSSTG